MKTLVYPADCATVEQRYRFACRAKEEMIREHNLVSRMAKEPLTREQYDKGTEPLRRDQAVAEAPFVLPAQIKAVVPYRDGVTLPPEQFKAYLATSWQPRMEAVQDALAECRKAQEDLHAKSELAVDTGTVTRDVGEVSR